LSAGKLRFLNIYQDKDYSHVRFSDIFYTYISKSFKVSVIKPLLKKKKPTLDSEVLDNYRPISLFLSKVLEKNSCSSTL